MRRIILMAVAVLALGAPLSASAQQNYSSGLLQLYRHGHNQWGAPGEEGLLNWEKKTGQKEITVPFGIFIPVPVPIPVPPFVEILETGGGLEFNITGEAGVQIIVRGRDGEVNVNYPMEVNLTYPNPGTLRPGDQFSIGSTFTRSGIGSMSSTAPEWAFALRGLLTVGGSVNAVVKILDVNIINEPIFTVGPADLSTTIFDTDFPFFKEAVDLTDGHFELFNGIVEGFYRFPSVTTAGGNGPGNSLTATGSDQFLEVTLSITDAILTLLGFPIDLNGEGDIGGYLAWEFHLLDLFFEAGFSINQNFTFQPKPKITLQGSNALPAVQFDAGTSVNLVMPNVPAGATANDLTFTPTFTTQGDVKNASELQFDIGLFFDILSGSLTITIESINETISLGLPVITIFDETFSVPLIEKNFNMKGFNAITTGPFTIEGYRYPTATISSLNPTMVKQNSGAFALTVNGEGFVDAYTNMAGTIPSTVVRFNGSDRVTTFVNTTQVTAAMPAADTAVEGIHQITAFNPPPGGGLSNSLPFIVDGSPPTITGTANPAALERSGNPNILISVTITGSITDSLSGVNPTTAKFSVEDEYNLVEPSGDITLNPDGTYQFVVRLAPTRQPMDSDGRLYQVKIEATDNLGFVGTKTINVVVEKG